MEWEALLTLIVFGASVAVVVAAIVLSLWGFPGTRAPQASRLGEPSRTEPRGVIVEFRRRPKSRTARR